MGALVFFSPPKDVLGQVSDFNDTDCSIGANAGGDCSAAIGRGAITSADFSIAIGDGASASGSSAVELGAGCSSSGEDAAAIGFGAESQGELSFTFGDRVKALDDFGMAIGRDVISDENFAYIFGRSAGGLMSLFTNDIPNSIMFGMNSDVSTMFIEDAGGSSGNIGRVGIGTTDPDGLLHLKDESGDDTYMIFEKGTSDAGGIIWHNGAQTEGTINAALVLDAAEDLVMENRIADEDIIFQVNDGGTPDTEIMRIVGSTSRVGIGTNNPTERLHVVAAAVASSAERMAQFSVSDGGSNEFIRLGNGTATNTAFQAVVQGRCNNTTEPGLHVIATVDQDPDENAVPVMIFASQTSTGNVAHRPLFRWNNNGTAEMQMLANGNLGIGTTAPTDILELGSGNGVKPGGGEWIAPSDINLKQDIEEFTDGLEVLLQFQPKWYRYNGTFGLRSDERYVGVIAQEVREIAPYMIDTVTRIDTILGQSQDFLNYDGTPLTYIIVNSIKELEQRVAANEELTQLVTNLNEQVNYLQQMIFECCNTPSARYGSEEQVEILIPNKSLGQFIVLKADPNPFSDQVNISFHIPYQSKNVEILISDSNGQLINRFDMQARGDGEVTFYGSGISSGIYHCSLVVDGRVAEARTLIKNSAYPYKGWQRV